MWTSIGKLKYCVVIIDHDSRFWVFSGDYLMMLRIFENKINVTWYQYNISIIQKLDIFKSNNSIAIYSLKFSIKIVIQKVFILILNLYAVYLWNITNIEILFGIIDIILLDKKNTVHLF